MLGLVICEAALVPKAIGLRVVTAIDSLTECVGQNFQNTAKIAGGIIGFLRKAEVVFRQFGRFKIWWVYINF